MTQKFSSSFFCDLLVELKKNNGQSIDDKTLFITINPNRRVMVDCILKNKSGKVKKVKRPYGMITQKQQQGYCVKVFNEDIRPWLESDPVYSSIAVTELTKSGDAHMHFVVFQEKIKNDILLHMFRRDVYNGVNTQKNIINGGKDYMNNIVMYNGSKDLKDYLMKTNKDCVEAGLLNLTDNLRAPLDHENPD